MTKYLVYLYKKGNQYKALTEEQTISEYLNMEKDGWVHVETIDACEYIQKIYNKK